LPTPGSSTSDFQAVTPPAKRLRLGPSEGLALQRAAAIGAGLFSGLMALGQTLDLVSGRASLTQLATILGFGWVAAVVICVFVTWRSAKLGLPSGWVVTNGAGDKFRSWNSYGSCWVDSPAEATFYARRADAELVHAEDLDAWHVIQRPLPAAR
jgi:hypothetical protein